jgi:cytochrome c-type biogenesis protein
MSFLAELALSFGLGVAANLNPCVLPLYPGFLSYISSKPEIKNQEKFTRLAGFLVIGGVFLFMGIIGLITATLGLSIGQFVGVVSPVAFAILIILGVMLLFNIKLTKFLPQWKTPILKNPYSSSIMFGLAYGPIVIPCNAPLVFAVFAYAAGVAGFLNQFALFIAFGLGLGLPLFVLSFVSAANSNQLILKFVKYHTPINRVAGSVLILLGLYELIYVFRVFG